MKIALCDDLSHELKQISEATNAYLENLKLIYSLNRYTKSFELLDDHKKSPFDLVLLDICMPVLLGTDVARELKEIHNQTEVIFLTTSNEFAIDAFEIHALHYILKPFSTETFVKAVDRAIGSC